MLALALSTAIVTTVLAGWRISHRNHHANHGHVENDESWHPVRKSLYDDMVRVRGWM